MAAIHLRSVCETVLCDPQPLDVHVFDLWLAGREVATVAETIIADRKLGAQAAACLPFIEQDVRDQFAAFAAIEPYLCKPEFLHSQMLFQLKPDTRAALVEHYYQFDAPVLRCFLGVKLQSKSRKDLEPIAELTGVHVRSCKRQFDNLRRITRTVFESKAPVRDVLQTVYLLSPETAERYARVLVYMLSLIDTTKKRVAFLTSDDLETIAAMMLDQWTLPGAVVLDPTFVEHIRDLKSLLADRDVLKSYSELCIGRLQSKISPSQVRAINARFREFMRSLLSIGAGLSSSKEIRQFLVEVVEALAEPCSAMNIDQHEVEQLFQAVSQAFNGLEGVAVRNRRKYWESWRRYLNVVRDIVLHCLSRAEFTRRMAQ